MQTSSRSSKMLYIIGAILTISGSFLPWVQGGDLIPYWENGIDFDHLEIHECFQVEKLFKGLYYCPIEDNGGLVVVLASLATVLLVFRPPATLKRQNEWIVLCSGAVVFLTLRYLVPLLIYRPQHAEIGAPVPQSGLFMVFIGSLLMFDIAIWDYRRSRMA